MRGSCQCRLSARTRINTAGDQLYKSVIQSGFGHESPLATGTDNFLGALAPLKNWQLAGNFLGVHPALGGDQRITEGMDFVVDFLGIRDGARNLLAKKN
jgi:hypothetical protein